jgi:YYY domain-containing protein
MVRSLRDAGKFEFSVLFEPATTLLVIFTTGVTAYIPWYISFSSQAGGILPNAFFATRFHQFFVMFGPFIVLIGLFLIYQVIKRGRAAGWGISALVSLGVVSSLILVTTITGLIGVNTEPAVANYVLSSTGAPDISSALAMISMYRLSHPILPAALAITLFVTLALLIQSVRQPREESSITTSIDYSGAFVFILILTGVLLALGPEFVYLKDGFGQRLNTVFKFYYAAWVLWAIASAYGVWIILTAVRWPVVRNAFIAILTVITCASLIYPAIAIPTRIGMISRPPTLDGIEYIKTQNPSDYAAIRWLQENASADSVLLEAVGGSYSYYARFSSTTGLQTLIGWPGHESQWRGPLYTQLAGNREALVKELYGSANLERTRQLIAQFNIKYVVVGSLERDLSFSTHLGLEKFARYFPVVFQEGDTTIYQVDSLKGQETP